MNKLIFALALAISGTSTSGTAPDEPLPERTEAQVIEQELKDYPTLLAIAECESSLRHTLPDGAVITGIENPQDRGLFQINLDAHQKTLTEMNLNADRLEDNIKYAKYLYETEGTKPWKYSKHCWDPPN